MENNSLNVEKTTSFLGLLAKGITLPIVLSPAVGYFAKQVFLANQGIDDRTFSSLESLKTGLLVQSSVLLPVMLLLMAGILFQCFGQYFKELFPVFFFSLETGESNYILPRWLKNTGRVVLALMFVCVAGLILGIMITLKDGLQSDWGRIFILGAFVGGSILMTAVLITNPGEISRSRLVKGFIMIGVTLLLLAAHTALFGLTLYNKVSPRWGGGDLSGIRLVLKDDPRTLEFAHQEGINLDELTLEAENVQVITENDGGYYLIVDYPLQDNQRMFLPRDMIRNVRRRDGHSLGT